MDQRLCRNFLIFFAISILIYACMTEAAKTEKSDDKPTATEKPSEDKQETIKEASDSEPKTTAEPTEDKSEKATTVEPKDDKSETTTEPKKSKTTEESKDDNSEKATTVEPETKTSKNTKDDKSKATTPSKNKSEKDAAETKADNLKHSATKSSNNKPNTTEKAKKVKIKIQGRSLTSNASAPSNPAPSNATSAPGAPVAPQPLGTGAPRLYIPNPDFGDSDQKLKDSETKEILDIVMKNPMVQQKLQVALGDSSGIQIGDWRSGCLIKGIKFPTINLKKNATKLVAFAHENNTHFHAGGHEVRINKFYGTKRDRFYVKNNGQGVLSVKLEPEEPLSSQATIRLPDMTDEYVLAMMDIHWSLDNNHGAQHSINGQPYALDIQFIHYAKAHESLLLAAKVPGGIFITTMNFEAAGSPNLFIEPFIKAAATVPFPNRNWKQAHGPIDIKMLYPVDLAYYTYKGQYLNDPCVHNATWVVFRQHGRISYPQLQKLREMRDETSERNIGVYMPPDVVQDQLEDLRGTVPSPPNAYLVVVPTEVLNKNARIQMYFTESLLYVIFFKLIMMFLQ